MLHYLILVLVIQLLNSDYWILNSNHFYPQVLR